MEGKIQLQYLCNILALCIEGRIQPQHFTILDMHMEGRIHWPCKQERIQPQHLGNICVYMDGMVQPQCLCNILAMQREEYSLSFYVTSGCVLMEGYSLSVYVTSGCVYRWKDTASALHLGQVYGGKDAVALFRLLLIAVV